MKTGVFRVSHVQGRGRPIRPAVAAVALPLSAVAVTPSRL